MAGGINAAVEAIKAAGANAVGYGLASQSRGQELPPRHHPVLALSHPRDHDIGTLVRFDVYRTYNLTSVGHIGQDACPYCSRDTRSVTNA